MVAPGSTNHTWQVSAIYVSFGCVAHISRQPRGVPAISVSGASEDGSSRRAQAASRSSAGMFAILSRATHGDVATASAITATAGVPHSGRSLFANGTVPRCVAASRQGAYNRALKAVARKRIGVLYAITWDRAPYEELVVAKIVGNTRPGP